MLVTLTGEGRAVRSVTRRIGERLVAASAMSPERLQALNGEVRALRDAVAAAADQPRQRQES